MSYGKESNVYEQPSAPRLVPSRKAPPPPRLGPVPKASSGGDLLYSGGSVESATTTTTRGGTPPVQRRRSGSGGRRTRPKSLAPAVPVSSSATMPSSSRVKGRKLEITVVGAQPMSEVGFRDQNASAKRTESTKSPTARPTISPPPQPTSATSPKSNTSPLSPTRRTAPPPPANRPQPLTQSAGVPNDLDPLVTNGSHSSPSSGGDDLGLSLDEVFTAPHGANPASSSHPSGGSSLHHHANGVAKKGVSSDASSPARPGTPGSRSMAKKTNGADTTHPDPWKEMPAGVGPYDNVAYRAGSAEGSLPVSGQQQHRPTMLPRVRSSQAVKEVGKAGSNQSSKSGKVKAAAPPRPTAAPSGASATGQSATKAKASAHATSLSSAADLAGISLGGPAADEDCPNLPPRPEPGHPLHHYVANEKEEEVPRAAGIHDYAPHDSDELEFKGGDIILLHSRFDTNWYVGSVRDGPPGLVPTNYIRVIHDLPPDDEEPPGDGLSSPEDVKSPDFAPPVPSPSALHPEVFKADGNNNDDGDGEENYDRSPPAGRGQGSSSKHLLAVSEGRASTEGSTESFKSALDSSPSPPAHKTAFDIDSTKGNLSTSEPLDFKVEVARSAQNHPPPVTSAPPEQHTVLASVSASFSSHTHTHTPSSKPNLVAASVNPSHHLSEYTAVESTTALNVTSSLVGVSASHSNSAAAAKKPIVVTGPRARALYDFGSKRPGDLSLFEGDIVKLLGREGSDWLVGELAGRKGVFPSVYVEIVEDLPCTEDHCRDLSATHYVSDSVGRTVHTSVTNRSQEQSITHPMAMVGTIAASPAAGRTSISQSAAPAACTATAAHEFQGLQGELSFKAGDVITVTSRVNADWLMGRLGGREGQFPEAFLSAVPEPYKGGADGTVPTHQPVALGSNAGQGPPVPQQQDTRRPIKVVIAEYDHNSATSGDLCFVTGEFVTVLEMIDADWATGRIGSNTGMFPLCYVKDVDQKARLLEALYDFDGTNGELTFKAGELIEFISEYNHDWLNGRIRGAQGRLPKNFVVQWKGC